MARLIYSMIGSLDGYVADDKGNFDWAAPDEEVHAFVNDLERRVGTYLYGRRMYETMVYWETADTMPGQTPVTLDFANLWRKAEKIVYSTTLKSARSERTRIDREFEPEAVRRLKATSDRDITVSGPNLAAAALRSHLVDELQLFLAPVIVGNGTRALPDHVHLELNLVETRRFRGGFVYLDYRL